MPRIGITFEDVVIAADQIKHEGANPTIEKIRLALGAGSNTTISKYLHIWKQKLSPNVDMNEKSTTPSRVLAAVDSVWQQIREQADAEIEKIREESRQQIELAQKQAIEALEERQKLNQEYVALQESYHAVSAEKEILTLDLRKLREEHNLLNARYDGLDGRYTDMQGMATHQLKMATDAHQNEMARLEQSIHQLKESNQKLVDEIKEQSEQERHRQMMVIENLKTDYQKQEKRVIELQAKVQNDNVKIAEITTELVAVIKERDDALTRLIDHEKKWQLFNDKVFVSDELIAKLNKMPELEKSITRLDNNLVEGIDSRFSKLNDEMKRLSKQMELQDE